MRFTPLELEGVVLVEPDRHEDHRGAFTRTFDAEGFAAAGLDAGVAQCGVSWNPHAGTLRGLHYQAPPQSQAKLVRCSRGAMFDVVVDVREGSATRLQSLGLTLSADEERMLFVPEGFAQGFLTLVDRTEVVYQLSRGRSAGHERGLRWNDPALGIDWPQPAPRIISERDAAFPLLAA